MNYLLLVEYFPESEKAELTGGVEARCFNLAKELGRKNKVIVLCSLQPGQKKESLINGARVIRCGPAMDYSSKGNIWKRLLFIRALYQEGKKLYRELQSINLKNKKFQSIDIIEGESFLAYPPSYFLAKKMKVKAIATWHETWVGSWIRNKGLITGLFGELWERFSLRLKWDKIIAVSTYTKEQLIKAGQEKERIIVIPNGIDLKKFRGINTLKEKDPTLCYFGRLNWQKNLDLLIQAVAEVKKEIPEIKCKIIGTGPARVKIEELIKELKLENNVKLFGYIKDYEAMLKEIKSCHLFVHPSTLEGFGITVLEAMASGLPYVITDIPPFVEVTHQGKGGEIFRRGDLQDLKDKILKLLLNSELYKQKEEESQKLVQEYDWPKILENYTQQLGINN